MEALDRVAPPDSSRNAHKESTDTWPTKMNLKYEKNEFKSNKVFSTLTSLHVKLLCEIFYCTYWAIAHIVHVVGTSGKQPLVCD